MSLPVSNSSNICVSLSTAFAADTLQTDLAVATVTVLTNSQTAVALDDSYTVQENQTLVAGPSLEQPGLVDNDFDLDGDGLSVTSFTWQGMTITVTEGSYGTATAGGASLRRQQQRRLPVHAHHGFGGR